MSTRVNLSFKQLNPNAKLPTKAYNNDVGLDIYCDSDVCLKPMKVTEVKTGLALAELCADENHVVSYDSYGYPASEISLEKTFFLKVEGRSGLARNYSIFPVGGIIDPGYRGEIGVLLVNMSDTPVVFQQGTKIAQLVPYLIQDISISDIKLVEQITETERGSKGFGSSGT
jgi:dUTP pyrophosphatase